MNRESTIVKQSYASIESTTICHVIVKSKNAENCTINLKYGLILLIFAAEIQFIMKIKNILLALALPAAAFLASCGDETASKPKPTLTFQTGAGFTFSNLSAAKDSNLVFGIRATSTDKKLASAKVTQSTNGGAAGTIWDTVLNAATFNYDLNYKVLGGVDDKIVLTFTVVDDNGETATQTIQITVNPKNFGLGLEGNQYVYNILGPEKGSYDLNNSIPVESTPANDAVRDIVDQTTTATFAKAWGTKNGTKFVKVTTENWNNASFSDYLYNLWKSEGSKATTTVTNLALNDIILCKTGQAVDFNIYLIKILEVKETTIDNKDYVKFEYKKADVI